MNASDAGIMRAISRDIGRQAAIHTKRGDVGRADRLQKRVQALGRVLASIPRGCKGCPFKHSQEKPIARPTCSGYWWWLPECFLREGKTGKGFWSVQYFDPNTEKCGVFVGPLDPPTTQAI